MEVARHMVSSIFVPVDQFKKVGHPLFYCVFRAPRLWMIPKTSAPQGHLLGLEPAEDVIKQMKFTIEGLDPDLKVLEGNVTRPAMGHVPKGSEGRMLGGVDSTVQRSDLFRSVLSVH
jgi:hypothetical protein